MDSDSLQVGGRQITFVRALGKGGFGSVHLAEVRSSEGLVHRMAVKVMHENLSTDDELAARARDEARLMSQLNHDNIVRIYGLTKLAGCSAVLMEYVEGTDCEALIKQERADGGRVPFRAAARIVECAAEALWAAFNAMSPQTQQPLRVVHRDIKPGNILVSSSGTVKVMDFGVARADFEREAETQSLMFGTQRYMAPERWLEGEAGHASDVFSLGVTFWELVTGQKFAQVPFAPGHFEKRIDEVLQTFSQCIDLPDREQAAALEVMRGMLGYRASDRLTGKQVSEVLGELSELTRGPSLRRYARRVVPDLVSIQRARLDSDHDLRSFTGTLNTASSGRRREVSAGRPTGQMSPELAATIFEAEVLPVRSFDSLERQEPPVAYQEVLLPSPSEESVRPSSRVAWIVVAMVALLGAVVWAVFPEARSDAASEELPAEAVASEGIVLPGKEAVEASQVASEAATGGELEGVSNGSPSTSISRNRSPVEPASVELVRIKILADPREGVVHVGQTTASVSDTVELPVGAHDFEFEGSDWTAKCRQSIESGVRKIKFVKETGSCVVLR